MANLRTTTTVGSESRSTRARALTVVALGAALLGSACSSFQDETTVVDLRILGIKAEPSEIFVGDPNTIRDRTQPFTTDITALVVDPQGAGRPITYDVLACPRAIDAVTAATGKNGVVCLPNVGGQPQNSVEVTPGGATADPTTAPEIKFTFQVPPSLVGDGFDVDAPAKALGFQLPIVVQMQIAAGAESIVATKRVIFSQAIPERPDQPPNANPVITTLTTYPSRDADAMPVDPVVLPADDSPVTVPLGGSIWFEPGGAVAEPYATRVLTRDNPPQVVTQDIPAETLRFGFFTTAGSFSPPETSTQPPPIFNPTDRIHLESQYNTPKTMPDDPNVRLWIVVRDERGGASWIQRSIVLAP